MNVVLWGKLVAEMNVVVNLVQTQDSVVKDNVANTIAKHLVADQAAVVQDAQKDTARQEVNVIMGAGVQVGKFVAGGIVAMR